MAQNRMNKYVWLVDTIHRAGKISLEDDDVQAILASVQSSNAGILSE